MAQVIHQLVVLGFMFPFYAAGAETGASYVVIIMYGRETL